MLCSSAYGIEKIAEAAAPPEEASYRELCDKFNLRMEDMVRPHEIDLLISKRRNSDHPKPVRTKGDMTHYKGPFGSVFGGTEPGLAFEPYVLNGLVQARQQTLRAVVKSAWAIRSDNVVKELENLIYEDAKGNARTMENYWSSENITGVLLKRAHPLELTQGPEVELFKTIKKKPDSPRFDVRVHTRKFLEEHSKATVVKTTRDNTDQSDLENKLMDIGITRVSLGGISAVGRTNVNIEITDQEHEQIASLHDEKVN